MKASDARRHSPEKLEVLPERRSAMRREGFRAVELAQALGVVRGTVYKWFRNAAACTEEQASTGGQRIFRTKGLSGKRGVFSAVSDHNELDILFAQIAADWKTI